MGLCASYYDAGCTAAPNRIPPWVLPTEEAQALFEAGNGNAPDLIYARGIHDTPTPAIQPPTRNYVPSFY